MIIRLLVVEDDPESSARIEASVRKLHESVELVLATNRDDAIEQLRSGFFDYAILDLRLPSSSDQSEADAAHGRRVFAAIREVAPGLPLLVLTGSTSYQDFLEEAVAVQARADVWGNGQEGPVVRFLTKARFDQLPDVLEPVFTELTQVFAVEISKPATLRLSPAEDRIARIVSRARGARRCVLSPIGSGLSDAMVLRAQLFNPAGRALETLFMKIDEPKRAASEWRRFENVVTRLPPAITPRPIRHQAFGAYDRAGIVFGFAGEYPTTLFELLATDPDRTPAVVESLYQLLAPWWEAGTERPVLVSEFREAFVGERDLGSVVERLPGEVGAGVARIVRASIQSRFSSVHADLHGANVQVSAEGQPVVLDYLTVCDGPLLIDPLTIELGSVFHPDGPAYKSEWPTEDQLENWSDLESYVAGAPFSKFVRRCREWFIAVSVGERERAVALACYALRQLKYEPTSLRALALLRGAIAWFNRT